MVLLGLGFLLCSMICCRGTAVDSALPRRAAYCFGSLVGAGIWDHPPRGSRRAGKSKTRHAGYTENSQTAGAVPEHERGAGSTSRGHHGRRRSAERATVRARSHRNSQERVWKFI